MIIKFNLLPQEKRVTQARKKIISLSFGYFYVFTLIVFLLLIIATMFYIEWELKNLEQEKNEKKALLDKYKTIALRVKKLEEENEEIKKRINAIIELKKEQGQTLRMVYYVIYGIKENKILINNLKVEKGRGIIKGYAVSYEDVANYLKNLEQSKEVFKKVEIKSAISKVIADYPLVEFEGEVQF